MNAFIDFCNYKRTYPTYQKNSGNWRERKTVNRPSVNIALLRNKELTVRYRTNVIIIYSSLISDLLITESFYWRVSGLFD